MTSKRCRQQFRVKLCMPRSTARIDERTYYVAQQKQKGLEGQQIIEAEQQKLVAIEAGILAPQHIPSSAQNSDDKASLSAAVIMHWGL